MANERVTGVPVHVNPARSICLFAVVVVLGVVALVLACADVSSRTPARVAPGSTVNYQVTLEGIDGRRFEAPVMVYIPTSARATPPLTVLVALHPFGGTGPGIGQPLVPYAEREGWLLVAPTFVYRDWRDPEAVRQDDSEFLPGLHTILSDLETRTGVALRDQMLLYGFSRGAQMAHRYALAYPESVAGVAAFSAGTYTLPKTTWKDGNRDSRLTYPFGVGDIDKYCGKPFDLQAVKNVRFLIGVGADDHAATDVPRNWDKYIGDCRLDRAQSFAQALRDAGVRVEKVEFPGTPHVETVAMRDTGVDFLRRVIAEE